MSAPQFTSLARLETIEREILDFFNDRVHPTQASQLAENILSALPSPKRAKRAEQQVTQDLRADIRNVLYRGLPTEIDADICRSIADEIVALLDKTRGEVSLDDPLAKQLRRRTFCPEDGRACYTPNEPEPDGFRCANYGLCKSFERDSDGTATAALCEDIAVPLRTAKRGLKASPKDNIQ